MDDSPYVDVNAFQVLDEVLSGFQGGDGPFFQWDPKGRGDVWISHNRRCVQWFVDDQCIRRFFFEQPVIKAGFVDFATVPNCLVIILRDVAHVYFLSKGDEITVCFPFPISNAFWYSQGIVLEREVGPSLPESEILHRFITLSDPMSPFGFVTFSPQQKRIEEPRDLRMLVFPKDETYSITVLFEVSQCKLHFYHTQVLTTDSEKAGDQKDSIASASHSADPVKNLRKMSLLNKRVNSSSLNHDMNGNNQLPNDSLAVLTNTNSRPSRNTSATVDRMSGSTTSPVVEFPSSSNQQQLPQNELLNQAISSKEIKLTRVSSMTLPRRPTDKLAMIRCVAVKFREQESIAILDPVTNFSKIWTIDLLPAVISSLSFKVYGDSPQDLIRLSNLDVQGSVSDILPVDSANVNGTLAVLLSSRMRVCLYNPFVELESPQHDLAYDDLCHISEDRMISRKFISDAKRQACHVQSYFPYPENTTVKLCFEAMKFICSPDTLLAILFLWQYAMLRADLMSNPPRQYKEFSALELVLSSLILTLEDEIDEELFGTAAFQLLRRRNSNSLIPEIIMGLHLVREELALNVLARKDVLRLGKFLYFATSKMNWPVEWRQYYGNIETKPSYTPLRGNFAHPLDEPPSILKSLYSVTENSTIPTTPFICFSRLAEMDSQVDQIVTPRTFKSLRLYELTRASNYTDDYLIEILTKLKISKEEIETFPLGMLKPLSHMLKKIESKLSQVDIELDLSIISRPDLEKCVTLIRRMKSDIEGDLPYRTSRRLNLKTTQSVTESRPKDLYTILTDVMKSSRRFSLERGVGIENRSTDDFDEGSSLKKNAGLIFSDDRRLNHVLSLLTYYKPSRVQFFSTERSYRKILKQKKAVANIMAMRTCSCGVGFGAIAYATEKPLATQKWTRPQLNLTYLFPDGTKICLQPSDIDMDTLQWGEFHGGVSSGLRISRKAGGINGSWIAFSKPSELDAQHGGFLLGLGLNGHLAGLEEWHVYNYLSPKKTYVSIGLLLGMSASMRGTMDLKLTKVLSVHTVAFLPPGSSDLNINLEVQTAGLIGMGLLYQKSQHRRMSDVLYSQLSSFIMVNEEPVSDEGYRLASGIALGLINLGAGDINAGAKLMEDEDLDDSPAARVMNGTGPDENIVVGLLELVTDTHDVEEDWIPENSQAGATVALLLIFLKTNNHYIAKMIRPNFTPATLNIRPDLFMFREWAYHMIMWSDVEDGLQFVLGGLEFYAEAGITTDNLPVYYTMAGRALAMAIKYASTGDTGMRDSLLLLIDRFLPFCQYPGDGRLDFKLAIVGINILVNVLIVSASMIMCGTGDLHVLRRIRYLREVVTGKNSDLFRSSGSTSKDKVNKDSDEEGLSPEREEELLEENSSRDSEDDSSEDDHDSNAGALFNERTDEENGYGKFLASSLSLGLLFLGSGQYALKTSSLESLAYLIITALPTYMNSCPLQETKHFWSMAVEPRCLVIKDATTDEFLDHIPFEINMKVNDSFDETKFLTAPCLLPDIRNITSLKVNAEGYYPLEVKFDNEFKAANFFRNGTILHIQPIKDVDITGHETLLNHNEISDIQGALRMKVNALESDTLNKNQNFSLARLTRHIVDDLELNDPTIAELKAITRENATLESLIYAYDLDMLCSDARNDDVNDYQLEIWRSKHNV